MSEPTNYLELEGLIEARLQDRVVDQGSARAVYPAPDLAALTESTIKLPAVGLHLRRERVATGENGTVGNGQAQTATQEWQISVIAQNKRGAQAARDDAGALIIEVIKALSGWRPAQYFPSLRRANAPGPTYNAGIQIYPLVYESTITVQGAPT